MANLLNLSKEESTNLLNLRKQQVELLCLEKKPLSNLKARVAMVIDYSGSMNYEYKNGTVQSLLERVFPLALQFDDNGEMEVWIFADGKNFHRLPNMTMDNYYGYVQNEIVKKGYRMGGTDYSYVLEDVFNKYMIEEPAKMPNYINFVTDGVPSDERRTKEVITKMSNYPIFVQFLGVNNGSDFLDELDDLKGRVVDNANYYNAKKINEISDEKLYDKLLKEYPSWLEIPKVKEMIEKADTAAVPLFEDEKKEKKKGLFGNFFG